MVLARYRRPVIVFLEIALVVVANYFAFWLRFDGNIPATYFDLFTRTLPLVVALRALVFIPFRLYAGLWRYTSLWDLRNIAGAALLSTVAIHLIVNSVLAWGYPRGVIVIDALLVVIFMTGVRLTRRLFKELRHVQRDKGVLIYGAGDAGEMVVRDMKNNPFYKMYPVGFIDDDVEKVGRRIHGVPVVGTRHELKAIMARGNVHEILIAMPTATAERMRGLVKVLEPFKVPITTVPNLQDLLDGKVTVNVIRSLALEDLLQRSPVGLDSAPLRHLIEGRRVLVTGAGGSIGSELCRQVARMRPDLLIMVERHEHSLYLIEKNIQDQEENCAFTGRLVDITNAAAVGRVFDDYQPEIVFHAAAHKHVPLMEFNPCEAIKNNVTGTRLLAEQAISGGADRFILISTDKAVNPVSVMGASKRIAELVVQGMAMKSRTCFNAVRFGNVLGSSGSVVPLFMDQIRAGGPVTVTHPEMRRYFMLIPEAVQLVLHAATLGGSGAIYVLDMGDEFKVVDLARNLIRLSGHVPDEEISIQYIGLRPGEKLSETLVGTNECVEPSRIDKISRVNSEMLPESLEVRLVKLEAAAADGETGEVLRILNEIISTFRHEDFEMPVRRARTASA